MIAFCGWYTLVLATIGALVNLCNEENDIGHRLVTALFQIPIFVFLISVLFK